MVKKIIITVCATISLAMCGCHNIADVANDDKKNDDASNSSIPAQYEEIIEDYYNIVDFRISDNFESAYNNGEFVDISETLKADLDSEAKAAYRWPNMIVEMLQSIENPTRESFKYVLYDMNDDQVPELFWVREDDFILAIFTIYNDEAKLLDAFWPRYKAVVTERGELYTISSGGADYTDFEIKTLDKNSTNFTLVKGFGTDGAADDNSTIYYEKTDGNTIMIDEERFDEILSMYPFESNVIEFN